MLVVVQLEHPDHLVDHPWADLADQVVHRMVVEVEPDQAAPVCRMVRQAEVLEDQEVHLEAAAVVHLTVVVSDFACGLGRPPLEAG